MDQLMTRVREMAPPKKPQKSRRRFFFTDLFWGFHRKLEAKVSGSAVELGVPFFKDTGSNLSVVTIPPRQSPRSVM